MGLGRSGTASLCVCVGVLASRCEVVGERRQAGRLTAGQSEKESVLLLFCNGGSQAPLSLLLRVDTPLAAHDYGRRRSGPDISALSVSRLMEPRRSETKQKPTEEIELWIGVCGGPREPQMEDGRKREREKRENMKECVDVWCDTIREGWLYLLSWVCCTCLYICVLYVRVSVCVYVRECVCTCV